MRDSNPSMVVSYVTLIKFLSVFFFFSSNSLIFKKRENDKTSLEGILGKRKGIEHWKYFGRVVVVIGMALTLLEPCDITWG